ncbi:hypothetical protein FACS1894171_2290 [Clostridia bacterium]|nr:hypothetical protein FACS1894171_2290 [Clostridia bacterium]
MPIIGTLFYEDGGKFDCYETTPIGFLNLEPLSPAGKATAYYIILNSVAKSDGSLMRDYWSALKDYAKRNDVKLP